MIGVSKNTELRNELIRKAIHLLSTLIPVSYYLFFERTQEIYILSVIVFLSVLTDVFRYKNSVFGEYYHRFVEHILREHEKDNRRLMFTGATYVAIAFLLCAVIFPKPLAITSMLILSISDSFAAIIGKVYGRNFVKKKTIEGSVAFFITGIAVIIFSPKLTDSDAEYYAAGLSVLVTTVFELIPIKIDDNIIIPMFFGLTYSMLLKIFL